MSKVTKASLLFSMNQLLPDNDQQEISAEDLRNVLTDMIDSLCSNSGEVNISGVLRYSAEYALNDDKDLVYVGYLDDTLTGYLTQGTNPLTEPLILLGDKIGFGGTPSGLAHFVLPNDASPLSKTTWTDVDVVFGEVGDTGKALGVSYTDADAAINMNFLEPGTQWMNAQLNLSTFSVYSGGSVLGLYQSNLGMVGIGTDTTASGTRLTIRGSDDSDDDYQLRTFNDSGDPVFTLRNDGGIFVHENPIYWKGDGAAWVSGDFRERYGIEPDTSQPAILAERYDGADWVLSSYRIL